MAINKHYFTPPLKMKIWVTEIGEPLPVESGVRLHRYGMLTKALSSYGHDVVWWTSSFSHAPKKHVCDDDWNTVVNGVTLRILKGPGYRKNVSYQRIRHQKHFANKFYKLAMGCDAPDLIISTVPTLEVAEIAVRFGNEHKITVIIDIRDEWPDELVDLAPKPLRGIARLLLYAYFKRMEYICQNATGIVAVSKSYLDYGLSFAKRQLGSNDGVFPLGYSSNRIDEKKLAEAKKWWMKQGVDEGAFICCFFGTIGKFFNLETVIKAANILSKEFQIQFVLCGDGSSLERYKKLASGTGSVIFPGWVDAPKIAALMEIANIGLAPYGSGTRMSLPNKPFEYFAGGLPVVSSIQGELKQILTDNGCGLTYDPDSANSLSDALRRLHGDEDLRKSMARQAIHLSKEKFSIECISTQFNNHIINVVEEYRNKRKRRIRVIR